MSSWSERELWTRIAARRDRERERKREESERGAASTFVPAGTAQLSPSLSLSPLLQPANVAAARRLPPRAAVTGSCRQPLGGERGAGGRALMAASAAQPEYPARVKSRPDRVPEAGERGGGGSERQRARQPLAMKLGKGRGEGGGDAPGRHSHQTDGRSRSVRGVTELSAASAAHIALDGRATVSERWQTWPASVMQYAQQTKRSYR